MIYLQQNSQEYDYDIRAICLAFYERQKIVEVSKEEYENLFVLSKDKPFVREEDLGYDVPADQRGELFMNFQFGEGAVEGTFGDAHGDMVEDKVICDYSDHVNCRNDVCRFLYRIFSEYSGKTLPWGMLTGIRPTKIMRSWQRETGDSSEVLEKRFMDTYLADAQKAHLLTRVAGAENRILSQKDYGKEYSLYIGIPFCPTTCLYCSFASYPVERFGQRMEEYLQALFKELDYVAGTYRDKPLTTIYIGGGTPTALTAELLKRLMDKIHQLFPVEDLVEFTVEAGRPDSITEAKLRVLKEAGVSRISINPQTMHQRTLDLIGRRHTVDQTIEAFHLARELGFDNINMDIITGLPGESVKEIRETLEKIAELKPDCLTVHSLAIKRAAHLNIEMKRYGSLVWGSTNEMLTMVDDLAKEMGMIPYYMYRQKNIPGNLENIGYCIPGKECYYNILIMEEQQDILACGAGTSTKYVNTETGHIVRSENVKSLDHYINRVDEMIQRKVEKRKDV
ncbi:MAG: coproporphyrinogen dehydrogenase HemZ [Lachnospiraceae bacterium]|nr:coproporphyrinogen dehydrogenase HemZ [Lachnospiraceae bacterium]